MPAKTKSFSRGRHILLALQWMEYLEKFEAIDSFNPLDGSSPPNGNPWGFTADPKRIHPILEQGFGLKQDPPLFDSSTLPRSCVAHGTSLVLQRLLADNPVLNDIPLDINVFVGERPSEGREEDAGDQDRERFRRFLQALADGTITEDMLRAESTDTLDD